MRRNLFSLIAAILIPVLSISAQGTGPSKAKIYIKKNENGKISEVEREVEIPEGQNIREILNDLDIWDDIPVTPEVQRIQLNIEKLGLSPDQQDVEIIMMYPGMNVPKSAFLGVMLIDQEGNPGATINKVLENTAAAKAGFQEGDVIYELAGETIESTCSLVNAISNLSAGEEVQIKFLREGKKKKKKVALGEKKKENNREMRVFRGDRLPEKTAQFEWKSDEPEVIEFEEFDFDIDNRGDAPSFTESKSAFLGITPGMLSESGVSIGSIISGSSAEFMGLVQGDIIVSINGTDLNNFETLSEFIRASKPGDTVEIQAIRNTQNITINGILGERKMIKSPEMMFFKDLEGMDENGDMWYNLEFDTDDVNIEMEELRILLDDAHFIHENGGVNEQYKSTNVSIEIDNVTEQDIASINAISNSKLKSSNDLEMSSVSFFPNPSNGEFNLKMDLPKTGALLVQVFDAQGSVVFEESRNNFTGVYTQTLDLSTFPDGTYYLQIIQNDKAYSKKLIKNS